MYAVRTKKEHGKDTHKVHTSMDNKKTAIYFPCTQQLYLFFGDPN